MIYIDEYEYSGDETEHEINKPLLGTIDTSISSLPLIKRIAHFENNTDCTVKAYNNIFLSKLDDPLDSIVSIGEVVRTNSAIYRKVFVGDEIYIKPFYLQKTRKAYRIGKAISKAQKIRATKGNVVKEFSSIAAASKFFNIHRNSIYHIIEYKKVVKGYLLERCNE